VAFLAAAFPWQSQRAAAPRHVAANGTASRRRAPLPGSLSHLVLQATHHPERWFPRRTDRWRQTGRLSETARSPASEAWILGRHRCRSRCPTPRPTPPHPPRRLSGANIDRRVPTSHDRPGDRERSPPPGNHVSNGFTSASRASTEGTALDNAISFGSQSAERARVQPDELYKKLLQFAEHGPAPRRPCPTPSF